MRGYFFTISGVCVVVVVVFCCFLHIPARGYFFTYFYAWLFFTRSRAWLLLYIFLCVAFLYTFLRVVTSLHIPVCGFSLHIPGGDYFFTNSCARLSLYT